MADYFSRSRHGLKLPSRFICLVFFLRRKLGLLSTRQKTMGGLRLRLMFKLRNSERLAEEKPKSKSKSPIAPYFRRDDADEEEEAENGRAEKFCLSPVNPKRLDISYPSPVKNNSNGAGKDENEGKTAGETAFKRHLAKATVVSMGCGCRALARTGRRRKNGAKKEQQQQQKKMKDEEEEEEEKEKEKEKLKENIVQQKDEDFTAMNKYQWKEEEKWHVVAKVNDEIVKKKVVLRRRNEEKCPPGSPAPSPEAVSVHSCFARRKNKNVQRKKKTKTKKKSVAKDAAAATAGCNYRLSTSSADTAVEATAYSWDNDHGSFVSDGNDTLFSASDYCKSLSSESSFEFYESRSPHLSTITESPARNNSRRSVRRSVTRRSRFSSCSLSPANVSPHDDISNEFADKLPLLSSPDSAKLFEVDDDYHSPKQSLLSSRLSSEAEETDLEANAKTWRDSGFPLRRDDIRTVIYKSAELRYSPNCLPFPLVTCGREINAARRKSSAKSKNPTNSSAKSSYSAVPNIKKGDGGLGSERKCPARRKSSKAAASLSEKRESNNGSRSRVQTPAPAPPDSNSGGKVGESVAVVKSSQDPYQDFRTSMLEMIVEKQIFQPNDLEQLLQCFLSLNSHQHHEIIVQVFTEIWGNIFNGTRNPSTPVAFFQNNVV